MEVRLKYNLVNFPGRTGGEKGKDFSEQSVFGSTLNIHPSGAYEYFLTHIEFMSRSESFIFNLMENFRGAQELNQAQRSTTTSL
jgi:hypothetical protein